MTRATNQRQHQPNEALEDDILNGMGVDEDNDDLFSNENDEEDAGDDDNTAKAATDPVEEDGDDEEDLTKKYKEDRYHNLVDDKGQIIAKAGSQREVFEKTKKRLLKEREQHTATRNHLQSVAQAGNELLERYKALRQTADYYKTIGLSEAEAKEALDLHARFKTDPKGALRYVLTKVQLAGNDLTDIGVSGPLDARAIADEAIRKFQSSQPKPTAKTPEQEVQEVAQQFLKDFPDAAQHIPAIAAAKQKFPQMTLHQIWLQYQLHQLKKQLSTATGAVAGKPKGSSPPVKPHNGTTRDPKRRGLDLSPRDHSKSFNDIGKELLRDIRALEEN